MTDDAVQVLTHDHREVEEMFALAESAFTDPVRLKELTERITIELVRHSVAEEQFLYPFVAERLPGGKELQSEELEDHAAVERTLKELEGMSGDNVDFVPALRRLMTEVRAHVQDEETQLFPLLQQQCSEEELQDLGQKLAVAKKVAPTRPHPSAPDTPPFNLVLDPGAGLVDRVRDALSGRAKLH